MRTSQIGYPLIIILVLVVLLQVFLLDMVKYQTVIIVSVVILVCVILLFFRLSVVVDDSVLVVIFGIGLIKMRFDLKDISSIHVVDISGLSGFGIRYTSEFMLYNVSGGRAIELKFKDSSRQTIRIGSSHPEELANFVRSRINA